MPICLDHIIVAVNDLETTVAFYTGILGLTHEGTRGPFATIRVTPELILQFAPWGTKGGEHFAFALPPDEFDAVFQRLRDAGLPYGDSFQTVGSMQGPGTEDGARGFAPALYFFDPSRHLIEIRCYTAH